MPPRKKTAPSAKALSAKVKKAAEAAEMRAASSIAKRVTRTAPSPQAVPIPPTVSAPKITKNQINVEVTLTPVEGRKIRLDFNIGKGDESANLSRKRTLQDAFLATCRLQGLDDVEVVQCTGVDGAACSEHTLSRIMGYSDDTFCTVTFRSAQVSPNAGSNDRRSEGESEDEDEEGGGDGWGWGYAQAL